MKFTVKKSLIGIAALSLLAPVASHADTTTGPTIKDGFNNRTKDGRGSKCVAPGGASQAVGADCMSEADAMNAKAEAEAAARKAAKAEADAAAAAAAQAARDEALLANPPGAALKPGQKGAYVAHGANGTIRDGYGRNCVKDGQWHPTMASEECDPDLHSLYRSKQTQMAESGLAPRLAAVPPEVEREMAQPQSELAPRLPYTAQEAVRPAPVAAVAAAAVASGAVAAVAADDKPAVAATDAGVSAADEDAPPDVALSDDDGAPLAAGAAGVGMVAAIAAGAAAEDDEEEAVAAQDEFIEEEETTPDMMMSDADRALSDEGELGLLAATGVGVAAALDDDEADDVADDDRLPGDDGEDNDTTPDMMLSEEDRRLPDDDEELLAMVPPAMDDDEYEDEAAPEEFAEEEETTPEMMLSEADRTLPGDDVTLLAAASTDDDDDDDDTGRPGDDDDDDGEETTPEMMMSDADRILASDDDRSPGMAVLDDTSPGIAPAPEKKVEDKPIIDNKVPEFPVTRYEVAQAQTQAPAKAAASLPVTINAQDGLFDFDRTDLKSDFIAKLDSVAELLRQSKVDAVSIVGHADPIGSAEYNQALSLRRAESAKRYLVGKGIDAKRISASGVGEKDLVVTRVDCTEKRKEALIDCLQPNRRVVVDVAGAMAAK